MKKLTARTIVLGIISVLAFIGYVFGYQHFTGNTPTNEVRWIHDWIWTVPFSVPHIFNVFTAIIILAIPVYCWRKKKMAADSDSDEDSIFIGLVVSMIIGLIIGLIITIIAISNQATAPSLIAFPITSAIIAALVGFFMIGGNQEVWGSYGNGLRASLKDAFEELFLDLPMALPTCGLGLGLGAAIPILPTFGTIPVVALILTGVATVVVMTTIGTVFNVILQWLLGPKICQWFYDAKCTGGF
ncbi:MAG: hypothetical protein NTZ18_04620 [Candidatus Komeilibacteria bacterium]|nr:hypothetical protein [Candidatus Komeilibacteria bacterium]